MSESGRNETFLVPDVPSSVLLDQARRTLNLSQVDHEILSSDFLLFERGKKFEFLTQVPFHFVSAEAVREGFDKLGYGGNTAVFIAWLMTYKPNGWYACMPDNAGLFMGRDNTLQLPVVKLDKNPKRLGLCDLTDGDLRTYVFVAFRQVLEKVRQPKPQPQEDDA